MNHQNSKLVWAIRYELTTIKSVKHGLFSTKNKELKKASLVDRTYVKDRMRSGAIYKDGNIVDDQRSNNEFYIIDEVKTSELMEQREKNIVLNAEKANKEALGQSDVIDLLGKALTPQVVVDQTAEIERLKAQVLEASNPTVTPIEPELEETPALEKETPDKLDTPKIVIDYSTYSIDQLRSRCDELEIVYHHKAGEKRLIELIINH